MEGLLEALLCVLAGLISLIVAIVVALSASERRFRWRFLAVTFALALVDFVAGSVAHWSGLGDDGIYWFSVPFFLLIFVSTGGLIGAAIGWSLRWISDQI